MTNLYINGVAVVLPSGFSISVKQENAFFTKNGEYTYDIELSLQDPVNARLYGFLNRLNTTERPETKRKAVLVADNRVYLNGTEIITGWTKRRLSFSKNTANQRKPTENSLLCQRFFHCSVNIETGAKSSRRISMVI